MTEMDWLRSIDPMQMIRFLMPLYQGKSDRKFRLFVHACWLRYRSDLGHLPAIAEEASAYGDDGAVLPDPLGMVEAWGNTMLASSNLEQWDKADLLRELFGNPFRPFPGLHSQATTPQDHDDILSLVEWRQWRKRLICHTAEDIYNNHRFEDMPILTDMLIDAGCEDDDLLMHCRGLRRCPECSLPGRERSGWCKVCSQHTDEVSWIPTGPHARGCWVLDLLLGMS